MRTITAQEMRRLRKLAAPTQHECPKCGNVRRNGRIVRGGDEPSLRLCSACGHTWWATS